MIYRLLFLLFAEARGLLPIWHPVYRDSYSIESLRDAAEGAQPASGLWLALRAIARLPAADRPAAFRRYREHYPPRRELGALRVELAPHRSAAARALAALGAIVEAGA